MNKIDLVRLTEAVAEGLNQMLPAGFRITTTETLAGSVMVVKHAKGLFQSLSFQWNVEANVEENGEISAIRRQQTMC